MWFHSEQQWGFTPEEKVHTYRYIRGSKHSKDLYYEILKIKIYSKEIEYSFIDRIVHEKYILDRTDKIASSQDLEFLVKTIFKLDDKIKTPQS